MSSRPVENSKVVKAAILIIGDEILSGRTEDANLSYMAQWLGQLGIQVAEVRIVADHEDSIVDAINALRHAYDYVLTTGGIGPTHDDITSDAVAKAFNVPIDYHPKALEILQAHYEEGEFNAARKRMARIPQGGVLIDNPISVAPGFEIENVFVMAGIPMINRAMLESIRHRLVGGAPVRSRVVAAHLAEGAVAERLGNIQLRYGRVSIGSYPYYRSSHFGTTFVLRSAEQDDLAAAFDDVVAMIGDLGGDPIFDELKVKPVK